MMHATFDTLKFVQQAEVVGIKREHAEFLAHEMSVQAKQRVDLATKTDIDESLKILKLALLSEFKVIRAEMETLQNRLVIRFGGMLIGGLGVAVTILGYIGKH